MCGVGLGVSVYRNETEAHLSSWNWDLWNCPETSPVWNQMLLISSCVLEMVGECVLVRSVVGELVSGVLGELLKPEMVMGVLGVLVLVCGVLGE